MTSSPIPALKPLSTGSEVKLATTSSRTAAGISMTPTRRARVAEAASSAVGSPLGATGERWVPVRIASAVVVVRPSGRDVPRMASIDVRTNAVSSPISTGSPATIA